MAPHLSNLIKAIFAGVILTAAQADAATPTCDRACLKGALDTYLNAVILHDTAKANLAAGYRATENAVETAAGAGIWKTATKLGDFQRRYLDPVTSQAAYHGTLMEGDKQDIASLRVKVDGGKITEAEWTIARDDGSLLNVAGLATDPPPPERLLAPAQRSPRFQMIALANGYFQGLQDHDGSLVPADPKCQRVENGVRMTFRSGGPPGTPAKPAGATPAVADESMSGNCVSNLQMFNNMIMETQLRRFPLVDEEQGVVMGTTIFRRPPDSPRKRLLLTEYFYVQESKLNGIWAVMYYMPPEAPNSNGWSK